MNKKLAFILVLCAATTSLACAPVGRSTEGDQEEERIGRTQDALEVANGEEMNGTVLNGTFLNGIKYNGIKYNGIKYNGIKYNGIKYNGTGLEGTPDGESVTVSGVGMTGADMDGELGDDSPITVRISSVSDQDVPGLFTYEITKDGTNICADGAKALLVPGRWDYSTGDYLDDATQFTVACRGAAIAKCIEWGYDDAGDWRESGSQGSHDIPRNYFHQACVRMVRADYCGDGHSHTANGTLIDVWDVAGVQTPATSMDLEAEWAADGAKCVKHVRWTSTPANGDAEYYVTHNCNSRWAGPSSSTCGSASSTYFTANGYSAAIGTRPLLRNASDIHTP